MLKPLNRDGGGNAQTDTHVIIRRTAAIGDALASTVVADKLVERGFTVAYQTHPNIHCVLKRHPAVSALTTPNNYCHVDLDGCYENDPQRTSKHFSTMFIDSANKQLLPRGVDLGPALNCRPRIIVREDERAFAREQFAKYPRPWIIVCPRSDSYSVRQVADGVWLDFARITGGTKFWIGTHPAPDGFVDLKARHLDNIILWAAVADVFVSVDTGPLHIAAALGTPIVAINQSSSPELHLSDQVDFIAVSPNLDCLNCQKNICPKNSHLPPCQYIDPVLVSQWTSAKWNNAQMETVSAVIAIYKPEVATLNRCLTAVVDQVHEVIVAAEANSVIPEGALKHQKIRYVRKPLAGIGYGRNVNHGVRHTTGKYLLLMNDDCFLEPNAVAELLKCMKPGVGMVSNLLFYPDGTIYHNGKYRNPGMRGWGHIDHKKHIPSFSEPREMENVCGCCILVRREAHFAINAFSERYFLFAEDDHYSLAVRRAGYKIIHTPLSRGIHMEHQSVAKVANIPDLLARANHQFSLDWSGYLDHNINRVPGSFDY